MQLPDVRAQDCADGKAAGEARATRREREEEERDREEEERKCFHV